MPVDDAMLESLITQIANTGDDNARRQTVWSQLRGNEAAVEPVMHIIVDGDEMQRLRITDAAMAIGKPMITALLEALYHDDSQVRRFAAWNLSHLASLVEQP